MSHKGGKVAPPPTYNESQLRCERDALKRGPSARQGRVYTAGRRSTARRGHKGRTHTRTTRATPNKAGAKRNQKRTADTKRATRRNDSHEAKQKTVGCGILRRERVEARAKRSRGVNKRSWGVNTTPPNLGQRHPARSAEPMIWGSRRQSLSDVEVGKRERTAAG